MRPNTTLDSVMRSAIGSAELAFLERVAAANGGAALVAIHDDVAAFHLWVETCLQPLNHEATSSAFLSAFVGAVAGSRERSLRGAQSSAPFFQA